MLLMLWAAGWFGLLLLRQRVLATTENDQNTRRPSLSRLSSFPSLSQNHLSLLIIISYKIFDVLLFKQDLIY